MGIKMFSETEFEILEHSPDLSTQEYDGLVKGENVSLELVIRARRSLDASRVKDLSTLVSKSEVNLLIGEINTVQSKLYLIFKILERKGLITMDEIIEESLKLDEKEKENGKAKTGSSASRGATAGSRKKILKSTAISSSVTTSLNALRVSRESKRSSKTPK